ncbi:MAG: flagellar biosynthetic protein FliQ [Deltaproteobacteria bacterium]|nr:flagellar biosynthetic protein FliQ [Deltaproteobacteria bacterium]MBN2670555.1 flagellar biosynthetic protein FliQ [Deltaproteobacteria bacterium]
MMASMLVDVVMELLVVLLLLSAPVWTAVLFSSVLVGVLTNYTKMSEPAIGVTARAVAVLSVFLLIAPWMGQHVTSFASKTWMLLEQVVR